MEPPVLKKARMDPFADLWDGASAASSSSQATGAVMFSGREELTRYKALEVSAAYDSPFILWHKHR